ncbi:MAG: NAD(P)-binding domain-containing protein [Oleiphilaceae bacterium]|nr:NAD(P)-binding domain-containing protein [Oleiphilaceae bacterium]
MYAVIGAGPMGLATARNLDRHGIDFTGFELNEDVGGLWDIDNPHSTVYDSAHLISSKRMTEFSEFPMDDSVADYPHHAQLRQYFRDYAAHFDLYRHYHFNSRVLNCEPTDEGWAVTWEKDGQTRTDTFEGVLIANGTLHCPNRPSLPGDFAGRVMHSSEYRDPSVFAGQRVLIVGCGNSGADIAVDAVHHARSVDLSVRRGYYFLPKYLRGRPIDTIGGKLKLPRPLKQKLDAALIRQVVGKPSDYGLPDPDYRLYESHPVMNSLILHHLGHGDIHARKDITQVDGHRVTFSDGSRGEYDLILQATGYKLDYPFIDREHLNWPNDAGAPQLYLNALHPRYDNLFMMGMIEAIGLGWQGRYEQAEMVALFIRNLQQDTDAARQLQKTKKEQATLDVDGGYDYLNLERMAYYVHKDSYKAAVAKETRALKRALPESGPSPVRVA